MNCFPPELNSRDEGECDNPLLTKIKFNNLEWIPDAGHRQNPMTEIE